MRSMSLKDLFAPLVVCLALELGPGLLDLLPGKHQTVAIRPTTSIPSSAQYQDGYRWAGEHAVNEVSRCSIGSVEFQRGCKDLVQDEMLDRWP